jgi:hypothetical protein
LVGSSGGFAGRLYRNTCKPVVNVLSNVRQPLVVYVLLIEIVFIVVGIHVIASVSVTHHKFGCITVLLLRDSVKGMA